jgi:hypothetical protein
LGILALLGFPFFLNKKKEKMNKKIIALAILAMLLSCNKNNCPDGYICQDDRCLCPDGSFETYGVCRPLQSNEYYGVTDQNCPCQDSIILRVTQWENGKFNFDTQRGNSWGRGYTPRIIRNDTIFNSEGGDNPVLGIKCKNVADIYKTIGGFGVISKSKDTITFYSPIVILTSNWENPDTCKIVFHR